MPFGKGGAKRIEPFDQQGQEKLIGPLLDLIGGQVPGVNVGNIQETLTGKDPLESGAAKTLSGPVGAESFLQGGAGNLGTAGGLFGQAQQAATAAPTDVLSDPVTQRLLAAQQGQAQSFLNQNLGQIGASAQRASGGVGSGSGETASRTRATTQAAEGLGRQQAQTLFGEQARLQNRQLNQAGILGQLGGGLGQLGLGQAGIGQGLLGQQIGLGGLFQGREAQSSLFPMDLIFQLGNLLKSSNAVPTEGFASQLIGNLQGGTNLLTGQGNR